MKRILLFTFISITSVYSFGQQQIGNGDMEAWANNDEPDNWNSFLSASGGFSGFAGDQCDPSSDTRPGSSGTSSCLIWSNSIIGNIANGNVTLGRINMGSITPSDPANHNYSDIGDAAFSEALTDTPDSIVFWVKTIPGGGVSQNARMKATLHTNALNYQDPENAASSAEVVAQAVDNFPQTGGNWERHAVAFNYSGPASVNSFILVTFTTNETPGGGNDNDQMWIDDVELIYNPVGAVDTDGDGVLDATEATDMTDPNDYCDFNPLSITEIPSGAWMADDCDGDGVANGTEGMDLTNPLDGCSFVQANMTLTTSAAWDAGDCDSDGVTNGDEITNMTDPLVTINELNKDGIVVSMNNSENIININSPSSLTGDYTIYNTIGQVIQAGEIANEITFNQLPGVYFVHIGTNGNIYTFEIIKN